MCALLLLSIGSSVYFRTVRLILTIEVEDAVFRGFTALKHHIPRNNKQRKRSKMEKNRKKKGTSDRVGGAGNGEVSGGAFGQVIGGGTALVHGKKQVFTASDAKKRSTGCDIGPKYYTFLKKLMHVVCFFDVVFFD